jgi:hypothetical protein
VGQDKYVDPLGNSKSGIESMNELPLSFVYAGKNRNGKLSSPYNLKNKTVSFYKIQYYYYEVIINIVFYGQIPF